MEMFMEFLAKYWVLALILIVCIAVLAVMTFYFKIPTEKQLDDIENWLLYAVTAAEKELGQGTGALKLRFVYDWFVQRFPWAARWITFDEFSDMVDVALEKMKEMLRDNKAVKDLVGTTEEKKE